MRRGARAGGLHWRHGEDVRYTAYVLEAVLVCPQGITLPISAEFCANEPAPEETPEQATARKQDCERQGVPPCRPAEAHLPAPEDPDCGRRPPIMAHCRRCKWAFMCVLPDDSLPSVWREANGIA